MNTRELVETYFAYVNAGRWDDYLTLFADDVVMEEQLLGRVQGIDAVAAGIEGLRAQPDFRNRPKELVVEGDRAMAIWHITAPQPDGKILEVDGVNYFRIEDGKIAYFANYHDTAPFTDLFG